MHCKREPIEPRRRWSKLTGLLTHSVTIKIDGFKMQLNSSHSNKGSQVMLPKLVPSYPTVVLSMLNTELSFWKNTSIQISWPRRSQCPKISS
jgi:hypothetical protein